MMNRGRIVGSMNKCVLTGWVLAACVLFQGTAWSQPQRWHEIYDRAGEQYRAGKLESALRFATQARLLAESSLSAKDDRLAQNLNLEAVLLVRLGRDSEAGPLYQRALKLREQSLRPEDARIAESLNNLAAHNAQSGQFNAALALHKRALAIRDKSLGPNHPDVAQSLNNLANVELALGRPDRARPLLRRALAILSTRNEKTFALWPEDVPDFGQSTPNAAIRHVGKGGLTMRSPMPPGLRAAERPRSAPDAAPATADPQAEPGPRADALKATVPTTPNTAKRPASREADLAVTLVNLGMMAQMAAPGRPDGSASKLYQRAIEIQERVLGPDHPDLAASLNNLAELRSIQRKFVDAEQLHKRALAIRKKSLGTSDPLVALSLTNLARLYGALRRPQDAIPLLERAVTISSKALGNKHPDVALSLRSLALAHAALGNDRTALSFHRRATRLVLEHALSLEASSGVLNLQQKRASQGRLDYHFGSHIAALHRAVEVGAELPDTARKEAFGLVQRLGQSATARALTQMAERFGRGPGKLAGAIRMQQDLAAKWGRIENQMLQAISALPQERDSQRIDALRNELTSVEQDIWSLSASIKRNHPDYVALASPAPATVATLQTLLNKDEALVRFHLGNFGNYAWVITKNDLAWARLQEAGGTIGGLVRALRCGLDSRAWHDFGGASCQQALKTDYHSMDYEAGKPLPFDLKRAHRLYQILFGPFKRLLEGRRLLVVTSGALTQIPLHVLVTDEPKQALPADAKDYAKAAWLMKRHAISVLPAATSLRSLRTRATSSKATSPFIGFGNPLLVGRDGTDKRAFSSQSCADAMQISMSETRARRAIYQPVSSLVQNGTSDVAALRAQGPLPETAVELCTIARDLRAKDTSVYLGRRATETAIKALDARGELANARVVQFATHGLVAAETKELARSLAEPSLILTPPDKASAVDDGLLTATEVTQLRLDADWVVLSACNTAAPRGKGNAEPLSGLARAFFYAGARALLVSHWYVDSRAATLFTTGAFAQIKREPTIPRSEAIRGAMLRVMNDEQRPSRWTAAAHPAVWAPFVLVGADRR